MLPINRARVLLALEFFVLCVALPTIIIAFRLAPNMFAFLWGAALYCLIVAWRARLFSSVRAEWNGGQLTWANLRPVLARWVLCSLFLVAFTALYDPDRLFYLPREKPDLAFKLVFLYPVLSALPQEFIFCSFFFARYAPFFRGGTARIIASAIVFAYAHVLFINWVAPVFSLAAGVIFARTYAQTRSLALVAIEHGLYGNTIFLVGLGWYFHGGAVAVSGP